MPGTLLLQRSSYPVLIIYTHHITAIQDLREVELSLFPVVHTDKRKRKIKLEDLKGLIPEDLGRAWTAIREKLEEGDIRALTELTEEEKSLSMLTRVSG